MQQAGIHKMWSELAHDPVEALDTDQHARLMKSLAIHAEALRSLDPESEALDYAAHLGSRGLDLGDLASLPGEDRETRLLEALAAYEEALHFFTPAAAPLDYAGTQNNRGLVLHDLAGLPDQDRRLRLTQALAAYDEALRFRVSDRLPLDYAATQGSRGNVLGDLAGLPGEDRRLRLTRALAAYDEALRFYPIDTAPFDHAAIQNNRRAVLRDLSDLPGEDRRARLGQSLHAAWLALSTFQKIEHESYSQLAANALGQIGAQAGDFFPALWAELNAGEPPLWLAEYMQWQRVPQSLRAALAVHGQARKRAEVTDTLVEWQTAVASGQQIIHHPQADELPLNIDNLRTDVAECWYNLGFAFYKQKRLAEARAAFGEALCLRPNFASWHCDRALTNIRLGDVAAAEADLSRVAQLEPDHPRLESLQGELAEARRERTQRTQETRGD